MRGLKKIEQMLINLKECCPHEKTLHECPLIETLISENKKTEEGL